MDLNNKHMVKCKFTPKFLLAFFCLTFGATAHAVTIEVTTTQDQNGEDENNCSLREAVTASLSKKPFGGCEAGQRYFVDLIQLKSETYTLNKEIELRVLSEKFGRAVNIVGADVKDYLKRDKITGKLGARSLPTSIITSANGSRLFNTQQSGVGLKFNDVILQNSGSENISRGGALLIGGSLTLNNVQIKNARANVEGGAIFLEGKDSSLNAENILLDNNEAYTGAAISQYCEDNLISEKRNIEIKNASIVNNKATGPYSTIFYGCGPQQLTLENVTFAKNRSTFATLDITDFKQYQSGSSVVAPKAIINKVTMVKNDNGIAYSNIGSTTIKESIIAFNGSDCKYRSKDVDLSSLSISSLQVRGSLLTGSDLRLSSNSCTLKTLKGNDNTIKSDESNTYVNENSFDSIFELGLKDYGLGLLGYMPKVSKNNPLFITGSKSRCLGEDKRGVVRESSDNTKSLNNYQCYLGSINPNKLTAIDDLDNTNVSYQKLIDDFENRIDTEMPDDLTEKQQARFKDDTKLYKAELNVIKNAFKDSENNTLKRVAIVNILANDLPSEQANSSGSLIYKLPLLRAIDQVDDIDNYTIQTSSLGSASDDFIKNADGTRNLAADAGSSANLKCLWLPKYNKLIAYKTNNGLTPAGKFDWCSYTITNKKTREESSAFVQLKFVNKAPLVEGKTIETKGYEEKIKISLSDLVSDNNDGPDLKGDKNLYLSNKSGKPVFIEITKKPEVGKLVFDDPETVDCPVADKLQTKTNKCYTGQFNYVRYNTTSRFGDTFKYKVYDCGAGKTPTNINIYDPKDPSKIKSVKSIYQCDDKTALSSVEAEVIINARTDGKKHSILEGGGSSSTFGLFLLWLLSVVSFVFKPSTIKTEK